MNMISLINKVNIIAYMLRLSRPARKTQLFFLQFISGALYNLLLGAPRKPDPLLKRPLAAHPRLPRGESRRVHIHGSRPEAQP